MLDAVDDTAQDGIPALYMRGGTSKGMFFLRRDLPAERAAHEPLLLGLLGSPDPYARQIDGLGGATSSTSKVVLIAPSSRADCDVDYEFGQVAIDRAVIDWSGNCGNLSAAVGPFALHRGLVPCPAADGVALVRIWQRNTGEIIHAHVPVAGGRVVERGGFELDGVTFPSAEIRLDFLGPPRSAEAAPPLFPTGAVRTGLEVAGVGLLEATLLGGGTPTVFVAASALGLRGTEGQPEVNGDAALLARLEAVRAAAAVRMGLAASAEEATLGRPHSPKLALVSPAAAYTASDGRAVRAADIALNARIVSMGKLHHAMTGTGAIALAMAAAVSGTVVQAQLREPLADGQLRFGHPSGTLAVGAAVVQEAAGWRVERVTLSRSARRLMEGRAFPPAGRDTL